MLDKIKPLLADNNKSLKEVHNTLITLNITLKHLLWTIVSVSIVNVLTLVVIVWLFLQ